MNLTQNLKKPGKSLILSALTGSLAFTGLREAMRMVIWHLGPQRSPKGLFLSSHLSSHSVRSNRIK